jgi:hypothetical protein
MVPRQAAEPSTISGPTKEESSHNLNIAGSSKPAVAEVFSGRRHGADFYRHRAVALD